MIVSLYVDDLIFKRSKVNQVEEFKEVMNKEFEMIDLGLLKYFLGLEVVKGKEGIFMSLERYVDDILKKFKMKINATRFSPQ